MIDMRERRYIKLRVDMYDDTKSKIIDRRPERDLIHYILNRVIVLAGKCDQEGYLYMSRTIPYTVETLSIEFNRGIEEVKLALDLLMELEIVELTEDFVYRVKNFVKHQNINVKEKNITKDNDKGAELKKKEVQGEEVSKNQSFVKEVENEESVKEQKQFEKETITKINENESKNVKEEEIAYLEINQKVMSNFDYNITKEKVDNNPRGDIPVFLEVKSNKMRNKNNMEEEEVDFYFEENDENPIYEFRDDEIPLSEKEFIMREIHMFG
jgi:predicted phage replisome organizer